MDQGGQIWVRRVDSLGKNKEQTGSWAVIQGGSHEREVDGSTSWC